MNTTRNRPGLTRVGMIAFVLGALAWPLVMAVAVYAPLGAGETVAARVHSVFEWLVVVAPAGVATGGLLAIPPGRYLVVGSMPALLVLTLFASLTNGFFWGVFAEITVWARVQSPGLFWGMVLGLGAYWCAMVASFLLAR